jgi:hypothetical protein
MNFDIEENEAVSMAVVRAVSAVEDIDPCSTPPLADEIDPDALDALFEPGPDGAPRNGGRISFVFASYRVTVDNGEYLTVRSLS